MSILAKWSGDAGIRDTLVQAGVLADSSADSAISGRICDRGIRSYKLAYEAFYNLLLENMESFYEADAWNQSFIYEAKMSWPVLLKIYQHPSTLNTKIPGNFRPTINCFSNTKIILQETEEIWQNFCQPFWIW